MLFGLSLVTFIGFLGAGVGGRGGADEIPARKHEKRIAKGGGFWIGAAG